MKTSHFEKFLADISEKLSAADDALQSEKYGSTSRCLDEARQMINRQFQALDDEEQPDRYRWENGRLYEYDQDAGAYLFVAAGNGRTERETIAGYESRLG